MLTELKHLFLQVEVFLSQPISILISGLHQIGQLAGLLIMVFAEFRYFGLEMRLRSQEHDLFLPQTLILVREVLVPEEPLLRLV